MSSNLSVIIVSWNVRDKLRRCLQAVLAEKPFEILVIDNGSQDDSAEMVRQDFPKVKLITQSTNLGFAKASNMGIKQARGEIILLLNPDTEIYLGSLAAAIDFFQQNNKVGIVGGQLINEDSSIQASVRRLPLFWPQLVVLLKLRYLWPSLLNHYLMRNFNYHQLSQVEQVSGAFFFIKRELIEQIGYLDEKFWLWYEEVDYCKRAKDAWWQVWYLPQARAKHVGGTSFVQLTHLKRQRQFNKSMLWYFKKHHIFLSYAVLAILSPFSLLEAMIIDLIKTK
ncbi:MAG: glycosyltransferase family 2 protein [Patescibacteria group bacterium]